MVIEAQLVFGESYVLKGFAARKTSSVIGFCDVAVISNRNRQHPVRASSRQVVWSILKSTSAAQGYLNELYRIAPEISILAQLARSLFDIVRNRDISALTTWIASARDSALHGFASRLERDKPAVEAALQLPWSNGHVEGQVHRLKLIKRQMYGRAGFHLLRMRVLQNA